MKPFAASMNQLPDVNQLRAALAVLETGSVTAAADLVGLTQPAVSRLVALLEMELGFALFHRERRRLIVSDQGRTYLREAAAQLGGLRRLAALGHELARGRSGLLRFAAVPALAHGLAPRVLAALTRQIADLTVEVEELDRAQQIEGLLTRRLDVGLVALPIGAPGLRVDVIAQADAVCLLRADHELARHASLTPETIGSAPFVRLRERRLLEQMVDDAFAGFGRSRTVSVAVDSTPLMLTFVADGLGIAIMHKMTALIAPPGVVARPFRPALTFSFAAMTRADEPPSTTVAAFIELSRAIAGDMIAGP